MPPFGLLLLLLQPPAAPTPDKDGWTTVYQQNGVTVRHGPPVSGAEHPELVPEEDAWRMAFDLMAGDTLPDGDLPIPTDLYHVATPDERAALRREALALKAWYAAMETRGLAVAQSITIPMRLEIMSGKASAETTEKWQTASAQMEVFAAEHKAEILAARDRLLAPGVLSVDLSQALVQFVEEHKKGWSKIPRTVEYGPTPKP